MAQQTPAQYNVREEERVLGIAYDRAVRAVPALVKQATGASVEELGDGYWVATLEQRSMRREVTVRLGKQGPDTRFSVRAETTAQSAAFVALVVVVGILTMGIGILALIPLIQGRQRKDQRERDLLVHKTFRAIEDAVAEQGAAPGYRIAPGVEAARPKEPAEPAEPASAEAHSAGR